MDKIEKFLRSLSKKERVLLTSLLSDIRALNIQKYDVRPLKGYKGLFRLRKGQIRVVFSKGAEGGRAINIAFRKDIYKDL